MIVNIMTRIAPWPLALFALTDVKYNPAVVGVPLITGPEAVRPGGSWAILKLVGLFEAVSVYVNAVPTVPTAAPELVMVDAPAKPDRP